MDDSDRSGHRRPSDQCRPSPSYFRNVVSLDPEPVSPLPECSPCGGGNGHHRTTPRSHATPRSESGKGRRLVDTLAPRLPDTSGSSGNNNNSNSNSNNNNHNNPSNRNRENFRPDHGATVPSASPPTLYGLERAVQGQGASNPSNPHVRSRRIGGAPCHNPRRHQRRHRGRGRGSGQGENRCHRCCGVGCGGVCWCCRDRKIVRSTLSCMNVVARILSWCTVVASVAGVVWYSYELKKTGKDPHLILWNSAAAFVLIGFPLSIYGIVAHLSNYNQPETQVYIVRILFMVPIFSVQSWLGLRFKEYSIYFETIRDFYEAYVLYSFLQFLIEVLGGEEALILMLKDKSPTRGVHIWGFHLCLKPWLMGQPVRKTYMNKDGETILTASGGTGSAITASETSIPGVGGLMQPMGGQNQQQPVRNKPLKRVYWTSPFFLQCKLGVLQYVLLKLASTIAILILEPYNLYKEGSFSYKGGYLYICILTNVSQTWALYCFFFFYFATKNELTPIRPVGKFLSVKLLVFFTWWQSLFISILYQMQLIPHYTSAEATLFGGSGVDGEDLDLGGLRAEPDWSVPLSPEDAAALDEFGGNAFWSSTSSSGSSGIIEYSPEDVAKALQDYLICIEMFIFAIVHIFVFPHTEYSPEAVKARARALNQMPNKNWNKRLGRKWKEYDNKSAWSGTTNTSKESGEIELYPRNSTTAGNQRDYNNPQQRSKRSDSIDDDDLRNHPLDDLEEEDLEQRPLLEGEDEESYDCDDNSGYSYDEDDEYDEEEGSPKTPVKRKNFFSALLDSTIPQDLRDNTVGIIKGEYVVERKTLLHHAATSDSYDLLSRTHKHNKGASQL